jgi:hypothetical protein
VTKAYTVALAVALLGIHERLAMKIVRIISTAQADPCLIVTLTGSMGGPPTFNGLAGPGTLVQYGDISNNCNAVKLQFDAGRGTNMRLSQIGVPVEQLNAIFFTHMHTDHTEGFADILQLRWHFNSAGPKIDVVCSSDTESPLGFTMSCEKFALHIGDAFIQSGEIAQRLSGRTLSRIRPFTPSWDRACRRCSSIARARPPISVLWRSGLVRGISCSRICSRRSARSAKAPGRFRAGV